MQLALPRLKPAVIKYPVLAVVIVLTVSYLTIQRPTFSLKPLAPQVPHRPKGITEHPVERLIKTAEGQFEELLNKQSHDVATAARRYRDRRGRHPPPGFDAWFAYAKQHESVIVEDFFDRIYHDLHPFWALDAKEIRRRSDPRDWDNVISVRDNQATQKDIGGDPMHRLPLWFELFEDLTIEAKKFGGRIPDVNFPCNIMDESRVLVPWEEIDKMMQKENRERTMVPPAQVHAVYTDLPPLEQPPGTEPRSEAEKENMESFDPQWLSEGSNQFWDVVKQGCAPGSHARNVTSIDIYHDAPLMHPDYPAYTDDGYVANWTLSRDPCMHPDMRSLHGTFTEAVSMRTSQHLLPLFGGSKLPMNNDILFPPAMYLSTEELYAGSGLPGPKWEDKKGGAVWRGVASGGRSKAETWTHFHRHRLLQMLNGTAVSQAEHGVLQLGVNLTFTLPDRMVWDLQMLQQQQGVTISSALGPWLEQISDTGFTNLCCFPTPPDPPDGPGPQFCNYTDPYFAIVPGIPMAEQYYSKILPDVDGNSFSGRFRAFLHSTSLPLKATIYSEWHDDRLFPWLHFLPIDNSYIDIYSVLDFFLYNPQRSDQESAQRLNSDLNAQWYTYRDSLGEKIATQGRLWAEKVMRREDMALYTWRLVLEYARLCDDRRQELGWVEDLVD